MGNVEQNMKSKNRNKRLEKSPFGVVGRLNENPCGKINSSNNNVQVSKKSVINAKFTTASGKY